MLELNKIYNMDCMEGMKQFPDKYFELAIVDPPYFSGPERRGYYGRKVSPIGVKRIYSPRLEAWKPPDEEYFKELIRVSLNQIIWGCNYFDYSFKSGRIVWDKCNGDSSFSDCEIAYCSMHASVRLVSYMWNGMFQGKSIKDGKVQRGDKGKNEIRIHPTQKPIALYEWLLKKYAKSGDKILSTHGGSCPEMIAAYNLGFDCISFETDPIYYQKACERLEAVKAQVRFEI